MSDTKRVAIYTRVSTEDQAEDGTTSLAEQEDACRDWARYAKHEVVGVWEDDGASGKNFDRPKWNDLELACKRGEVDLIVCHKLDRYSREPWDGGKKEQELRENMGVGLVLLNVQGTQIDTSTPTGLMLFGILLLGAAWERMTIIDRMARGAYAKVRRGGAAWPSSHAAAPFGLAVEGEKREARLVIHEGEAATIQEAARLLLDGTPLPDAVASLNGRGMLPRKSAQWSTTLLLATLAEPARYGYVVWGKPTSSPGHKGSNGKYGKPTVIEGVPAVLDKPTWDRLQAVLALRQRGPYRPDRVYPLSLRMVSPCGELYTGIARNDLGYAQYRCRNTKWRAGHTSCGCRRLRAAGIEARVWSEVVELLSDPARLHGLAAGHLARAGIKATTAQGRVDELDAAAGKLRDRKDKTITGWIRAGRGVSELAGAMDELDREISTMTRLRDEAARELADAAEGKRAFGRLEQLAQRAQARLAGLGLAGQAEVLSLLGVRVTVLDGGKVPALRIEGTVCDLDSAAPSSGRSTRWSCCRSH